MWESKIHVKCIKKRLKPPFCSQGTLNCRHVWWVSIGLSMRHNNLHNYRYKYNNIFLYFTSTFLVWCRWRPVSFSFYLWSTLIWNDWFMHSCEDLHWWPYESKSSHLSHRENKNIQQHADCIWRYVSSTFRPQYQYACCDRWTVSRVLQSKLLKKAASMLVTEIKERKLEKERVVSACFPALTLSGLSAEELKVTLSEQIKVVPMILRHLDASLFLFRIFAEN